MDIGVLALYLHEKQFHFKKFNRGYESNNVSRS